MLSEKIKWPSGCSCAVMISVNLDAEFFGKIYYPDVDVNEGDIFRLGQVSIRYGLPKLLETLEKYDVKVAYLTFDDGPSTTVTPKILDTLKNENVKATFFIPGEVARRYPDAVKMIFQKGHEIGCHGDQHEIMAHLSLDEQRNVLERATKELKNLTEVDVKGFRMPEGEMNLDTYRALKSLGYRYSSSLSDDDIPYIEKNTGILELPIHWELFDLPYFTFTFDPPIPPGQARSARMDDVLENWFYELEGARRWGTLLNLQLDPQAIGEQGRIFMLEKFLDKVKESGDVWLTNGGEIAEYFEK